MLNRDKVIQELSGIGDGLFKQQISLQWLDKAVWQKITTNPQFLSRIQEQSEDSNLARSLGDLSTIHTVTKKIDEYAVLAVDGSQIYPDKHLQGVECFLINSGGCFLQYNPSKARLFSEPKIFTPQHFIKTLPAAGFSPELADLTREAYEFAMMADQAEIFKAELDAKTPLINLFDGNLLFWHLESKTADLKKFFLTRYLKHLQRMYEQRHIIAGYLSFSKFRDLAQMFDAGICSDPSAALGTKGVPSNHLYQFCSSISTLTDVELLQHVLDPGQRTIIFQSMSDLTKSYPDPLKPHFFYLNVGSEIVRIEIPAWIAYDVDLVDLICAVCIDQCDKGQGYPIALAEAHGQAVVGAADRDFFYQWIYKIAMTRNMRVNLSQKSLHKRIMSI